MSLSFMWGKRPPPLPPSYTGRIFLSFTWSFHVKEGFSFPLYHVKKIFPFLHITWRKYFLFFIPREENIFSPLCEGKDFSFLYAFNVLKRSEKNVTKTEQHFCTTKPVHNFQNKHSRISKKSLCFFTYILFHSNLGVF